MFCRILLCFMAIRSKLTGKPRIRLFLARWCEGDRLFIVDDGMVPWATYWKSKEQTGDEELPAVKPFSSNIAAMHEWDEIDWSHHLQRLD